MLEAKQFLTELLAICDANPDKVNPLSHGRTNCLYTDYDGRNHCVIGQLLANHGLDAGCGDARHGGIILREYMNASYDTQLLAPEVQSFADNPPQTYETQLHPRTWGEVATYIRETYGEEYTLT